MITNKIFDIEIFNALSFFELTMRFAFHSLIMIILIKGIYLKKTEKQNFLFTFLLIGISVFFICFLLESVKLQLGFALGLFAIFGIIRYRTIAIPIKEMTYLFIIIGLSIINALTNKQVSYAELLFTNTVILLITYITEKFKNQQKEQYIYIFYNNLELLNTNKKQELITDLEKRLGLDIFKIEVGIIDYQKNTVKIKIFFKNEITINNKNIVYIKNDTNI